MSTSTQAFSLALSFIMLKNRQTYFKNFAVWTPQKFQSMFGQFPALWMNGLSTK